MGHFDDAQNLISHSKQKINDIEREYEASLQEEEIKAELLIEIKNLMENLRSALDIAAHGLHEKYGSRMKKSPKIYFPYASKSQDLIEFRKQKRIEDCLPGISSNRPDIVMLLEGFQHWNQGYSWLPDFMDLNNENKHQRLTPQLRTTRKELQITSGNATVKMSEGGSISIGPGGFVKIGDAILPENQTINVNNPPLLHGKGKSQVITWISFSFESNKQDVLPFLNTAIKGIEAIVNELSSI